MRKFLAFILLIGLGLGVIWSPAKADELDDISRQIEELSKAREQSIAATTPLEGELSKLQTKLNSVKAELEKAKTDLRSLQASIATREVDFASSYVLLSERVLGYYKASRVPTALVMMFSNNSKGNLIRDLFYRSVVTDRDKDEISNITQDLLKLEQDKRKVEADKLRLADLQVKVDKEAKFFEGEIAGAKKYQASLSQQIAQLSAKQQSIISQRQAGLNLPTSLGAGPLYCTDDRSRNPGFSPAFAFYTYGIPHRVGMNQYGAYGRANAGKNYKDILNAYFQGISFEGGKENIEIKIQGNGSKKLDEYLLGIYEMPESWPIEALKAQAVAARSYALAYTNNGEGEICTTQACQVWKSEPKTGQWKQAVEETKGEIMKYGGEIVKAWYSSTDGGYTFTSGDVWGSNKGWTKRLKDVAGEVNSFSELNDKAYDRESPCFYAAQGWRGEYDNSAWLKTSEVADIVNVLILAKADSSVADHLYQTDKPHPYGGEVWNEEKVKSELRSRGLTPYNNVSSVSMGADFNEGKTSNVSIAGDGGSSSFSGSEFKSYFNLRAPANIQIVGPLYNVEKK